MYIICVTFVTINWNLKDIYLCTTSQQSELFCRSNIFAFVKIHNLKIYIKSFDIYHKTFLVAYTKSSRAESEKKCTKSPRTANKKISLQLFFALRVFIYLLYLCTYMYICYMYMGWLLSSICIEIHIYAKKEKVQKVTFTKRQILHLMLMSDLTYIQCCHISKLK